MSVWLCVACSAELEGRGSTCPNCGPLTGRQRADEVERLRAEVEAWRSASGLVGVHANGCEGDPGDVEPRHLDAFLSKLEAERDTAVRERDEARARVATLESMIVLHPNGRCGCAGEGRCQWCQMIDAQFLVCEVADVLLSLRPETAEPIEEEGERRTVFVHHPEGCVGDECGRDCGGVFITTELDGDVLQVVEVRRGE